MTMASYDPPGMQRVNIRMPKEMYQWYKEHSGNGITMQGLMWMGLEQYMIQREALNQAKDWQKLFEELAQGLKRLEEQISGRREPAGGKP